MSTGIIAGNLPEFPISAYQTLTEKRAIARLLCQIIANDLISLARPKGFEPLTPRFVVWCPKNTFKINSLYSRRNDDPLKV